MEEEETQTEAIQLELEVALENYRQGDMNPSGHIGVHIRGKKFRAQISVKNKKINLGTFNTAEEARAAYLAAIPDQEYQYVK